MFDISGADIACLSDADLRDLVGRLCEAELRACGFSERYVTWGGNQDAADGGIDVRVTLPADAQIGGFIPRANTGIQVKKPEMPPAKVRDEMRPSGVARRSIQDLALVGGAYVIVSGEASLSDLALANRVRAMRNAVADVPNADALSLEFYDRVRLATWVRSHHGLIPWVREKVGRAIQGWQSYESWAAQAPSEYFLDETLRIQHGTQTGNCGLSALEGIEQIRHELRCPRKVVRLVGLSGVGKTRLVRALFDHGIGESSLDPALVHYTNIGDSPDPQPMSLATDLVSAGRRAILVIDNCPAALHERLSELCRQFRSQLSVMTVEYDIRDDQPEGTEVFILERASLGLIENILGDRFPDLSGPDRRRIVDASDGNAKIALGLASTLGQSGTVAHLNDELLFQRLFHQQQGLDRSLYLAGQACSLVYSFDGEDESLSGELIRLANTADMSGGDMYRAVAELKRRDLVQKRGVWRALLPHALANRLATRALQSFSGSKIEAQLLTSERLAISFSRRLAYLHTSSEAVGIAKRWLAPSGLLGDVSRLNEFGRKMFHNVAPVSPEDTLVSLERWLTPDVGSASQSEKRRYLDLLRSLAYEPQLFERSVELIVRILLQETDEEVSKLKDNYASLFHLYLSGTLACLDRRIGVLESLLNAPDQKRVSLGLLGLEAMLKTQFFSLDSFEFGAWPRDSGYQPRNRQEFRDWFHAAVTLALRVDSNPAAAPRVRTIVANHLWFLWKFADIPQELVDSMKAIRLNHFWPEGWIAVRELIHLKSAGISEEERERLTLLEEHLRPTAVSDRVRAVVFTTKWLRVDLVDLGAQSPDVVARMETAELQAYKLGKEVAIDEVTLHELLPEMVSVPGRQFAFGHGLAQGTLDVGQTWNLLVAAFRNNGSEKNPAILRGFIAGVQEFDPAWTDALLEHALFDEALGPWYPQLQLSFQCDQQGVERLRRSLAIARASVHSYLGLAYSGTASTMAPLDLKNILLVIGAIPQGRGVALEILQVRLNSERKQNVPIAEELKDAGRDLLLDLDFAELGQSRDFALGEIAESCLGGDHASAAFRICRTLKGSICAHETFAFDHPFLLGGLFKVQPIASLDGMFGGEAEELVQGVQIIREVRSYADVLGFVPEEALAEWCEQQPALRYPAIASAISISRREDKGQPLQWSSTALFLLARAPDAEAVIKGLVSQFRPTSGWSGSLALILEEHLALLDDLTRLDPRVSGIVEQEKNTVQEWIQEERDREANWRRRDESFE